MMGIDDMTQRWMNQTISKRQEMKDGKRICSEQEEIELLIDRVTRDRSEFIGRNKLSCYPDYLVSKYWKRIRQEVLVRDKFACKQCGSKIDLQVDHIRYGEWGNERLEDLHTLCKVCHQKKSKKLLKGKVSKFQLMGGQLFMENKREMK
jgi:hypothetical protein